MGYERSWLVYTHRVPDGQRARPAFHTRQRTHFSSVDAHRASFPRAGGIALEAFALPGVDEGLRTVASVVLILVGVAISLGSAIRWVRIERSLRHDRPLPAPGIVPVLGLGVGLASIVVLIALF